MRKLLLILMMVSFAGVSSAYSVKGAGARSCGYAINQNKDNNLQMKNYYQSWILGFISGANTLNDIQKAAETDPDAIWYAVMNICQEKPLHLFAEAVIWVYRNELTE